MKTKLLTLILLITATCTARAHLIDFTPGGTQAIAGVPEFSRTWKHTFFDSAENYGPERVGWVNRHGILNGADYFNLDLFTIGDHRFVSISWDMSNQPEGFWLTTILVQGQGAWNHLYGVSGQQRFIGEGILELNGFGQIQNIGLYGLNPENVPDTGATLLLFGLALIAVSWIAAHGFNDPDSPPIPRGLEPN